MVGVWVRTTLLYSVVRTQTPTRYNATDATWRQMEIMNKQRPLTGLSIVNTRAAHQAEGLTAALTEEGAQVLHYPAIRIAPPADLAALDSALHAARRGEFDWLVLTSANTVYSLAHRLGEHNRTDSSWPASLRVAAVGSATADAARRELGLTVEVIPDEFVAESLAAALALPPGARLLLPQSEIARAFLADAFQAAGANVTQVVAYRTATGVGGDPVPRLFWEGSIDAVTFTSPSTVHNFLKRLKAEGGNAGMLVDVAVACIGPQTAAAARRHDLAVAVLPAEHSVEGLVAGLVAHFARRRDAG